MLFNKYLNESDPDHHKILQQARRVILEMRRDLGLSSQGLKPDNLDQIIFTPHTLTKKDNSFQQNTIDYENNTNQKKETTGRVQG